MTLTVNGIERTYVATPTLGQILSDLGIPPQAALVELNGTALRRDEWPAEPLREGDRLEILRIVAGG
jgi:thiamine biosynthesis protein ThiS